MPYSAEISRRNPACLVFLVDQSASMGDNFGSGVTNIQKASFVSDVLNRTLQNLVIACAKSEGIRDYFWVGVIGYGEKVGSAFGGGLNGRMLVPVSEVANNPARVEERSRKEPDGAGGLVQVSVKFPVWFDPRASGGTPMSQALELTYKVLEEWCADHHDSFPPVVLHITDGESTDGDPTPYARAITSLSTADGYILLLNLHVSSTKATPIRFPCSERELPSDRFAHLLYQLSSELPPHMLQAALAAGYSVREGSRGFVFNGGIEEVVDFFEIGTRPSLLR